MSLFLPPRFYARHESEPKLEFDSTQNKIVPLFGKGFSEPIIFDSKYIFSYIH